MKPTVVIVSVRLNSTSSDTIGGLILESVDMNDYFIVRGGKFPGPFPGPHPPLYMELESIIKEFVAMGREISPEQAQGFGAIMEAGSIRGGIRVPHLHAGSKVRLLDEKTWAAFAKKATDRFSDRLAKAKTVSFDQLDELANVINTIT